MRNFLKQAVKYSFNLAIIVSCTSCINSSIQPTDESPLLPTLSDQIPITISGKVLQAKIHSRILENSFEDGDEIGLYLLAQPETLSSKRHVENAKFAYSSLTDFVCQEEIYYPKEVEMCKFISYYPYQETGFISETNTIWITTQTDQSLEKGYSKSDFMVAELDNIIPDKKPVNLEFNHKLCQLNLILQPCSEEDIDELKQNASITINGINTQALYDISSGQFTNLNLPQSITPNGLWEVDETNYQLIGKRVLIIPQSTTDCELILNTGNGKTYSTHIPLEQVLTSGTSCELLLNYDSRVGIKNITSTIGDWKPGNNGSASFEEKEDNKVINIADLNFNRSNVYEIAISSDATVGEICKEYLKNDDIDSQAIVLYAKSDKKTGMVLQLLSGKGNIHGGKVIWNTTTNSFTYESGNKTVIQQIFVDQAGNIVFEKSEALQTISAKEKMLSDIRGNETKNYPIVKIGTQYWMRDNLSATKYNDGSTIADNTSELDKTSAGLYNKNGYYFYNKAAVLTGKTFPKGWRIPNETDWNMIKTYINDKAAMLKSGVWNTQTGIDLPNNLTGFNGKSIGIYYTSKGNISFGGKDNYVSYWQMGTSQTSLPQYGITLHCDHNSLKGATYEGNCAYAIRCIKE